jgi:hypothetical protein
MSPEKRLASSIRELWPQYARLPDAKLVEAFKARFPVNTSYVGLRDSGDDPLRLQKQERTRTDKNGHAK